eukprot:ctg_901.g208
MHDLSARHCTCLVAVLASGEALIYHGTMFADAALRFTRIDGLTSLTQVVIPAAAAGSSSSKAGSSSRRIGAVRAETFVNIDGHSGICLTGARPLVVLADSGAPTVHPLRDRPFVSLAELHNVACRRGLVTVSADGTVRVGQWRPARASGRGGRRALAVRTDIGHRGGGDLSSVAGHRARVSHAHRGQSVRGGAQTGATTQAVHRDGQRRRGRGGDGGGSGYRRRRGGQHHRGRRCCCRCHRCPC